MVQRDALSLEALRARVRELEGAQAVTRKVEVGVPEVDAHLGGMPCPGLVEVCGPEGSGRTRFAAACAAGFTRRRSLVAWVDLGRDLYPPGLAQHGVVLRRLLVVRPPHPQAGWAVEQVLRAGCFPLVVVAGRSPVGRSGVRWARAAEQGRTTGVILREYPERRIPAVLRLQVDGDVLVVTRDRTSGGAGAGHAVPLPPWPEAADPWG